MLYLLFVFYPYMLATTSTIAIKYKGGVLIAADTSVSYGSLAMTKLNRIFVLNKTLITFNGMVNDFLYIKRCLEEEIAQDKREIDSKGIFKLLQLFMYSERSRVKPKFCSIVIAGLDKKKDAFLGSITSKGVFWEDDTIATGFASHLVLPLLREKKTTNLSLEEAKDFLRKTCKVLIYKDAKASNKIQMGHITNEGEIEVSNEVLDSDWAISHKLNEIKL